MWGLRWCLSPPSPPCSVGPTAPRRWSFSVCCSAAALSITTTAWPTPCGTWRPPSPCSRSGPPWPLWAGPCSTCFSTCSVSECCCSSPPTSPSWATPPSTCSAIFSCMEIRSAGARSPCGAGDAAGLRPVRRGALP
ncbi:hypothetical protein M5E87_09020 [Flavonifractor plautii]|nr:hypothetical protein M5E87_09020 [Flavonifractor plautii]